MVRWLICLCLINVSFWSKAQSCVGYWITIDDVTGNKKSIVQLYKKEDLLYGKVVYIYKHGKDGPNSKCTACSGKRYNQPILGMVILWQMHWDGSQWENGTILDPDNGKTYDCAIWLNSSNKNKLNVRGYIGPFFRTQEWIRTDNIPSN